MSIITSRVLPCKELTKSLLPDYETKVISAPSVCYSHRQKHLAQMWSASAGVLTSRPTSRDIKISGFSMSLNGVELIQDCSIEVTIGRRYGLIGANGCGKTNFLQCIANREV